MKHITVLTYRFEGSNEVHKIPSEVGGRKLEEFFKILETKTILGKIDYAVFTKEVTS
tara:strand:- start:281 stop:451 length:171 start_codon:yes stop_codon:yes gene_type:complete